MFSWICPKCGREVPPSNSECPFCHPVAAPPAAPAQGQAAPRGTPVLGGIPTSTIQMTGMPMAPAPASLRPAAAPPPVAAAAAPPPSAFATPAPQPTAPLPPPPPMQWQPPAEKKLPNWLGALLAFAAVGAVAATVAWYTNRDEAGSASSVETKKAAAPKAGSHPYASALEVAGFRIVTTGKKQGVQFLVINHSGVELSDLGGVITVRAKGGSPEDKPAFVFKFKVSSVPPFGAKEVEVNDFLEIRKSIDMPDWQFFEPSVEITSPE